jgi:4-hydroxy-4-methyl-2-oxoglutarate aldolase
MASVSEASRPDADLLERLRHIDTASLSDASRELRVLPPAIRPLVSGGHMAGRAVTAVANQDLMSVIGALEISGVGDVLVVAAAGCDQAVCGELFGTEAFRRGMSGVVIDGLSRDSAALRKLAMPFYSRGVTPMAPPALSIPEIQVPLLIDGVQVVPGDIVVGDDDGIIVGTTAEFAAIVEAAEGIQTREKALRISIENGFSLFDTLNFTEHRQRLIAGIDSKLTFEN